MALSKILMGLSAVFQFSNEPYELRQIMPKISPEENNGVGVSTIFAHDVQQYETALLDGNGAHPVERYDSEEKAKTGHIKWKKRAASPKLVKITKLGHKLYRIKDKQILLRRIK